MRGKQVLQFQGDGFDSGVLEIPRNKRNNEKALRHQSFQNPGLNLIFKICSNKRINSRKLITEICDFKMAKAHAKVTYGN